MRTIGWIAVCGVAVWLQGLAPLTMFSFIDSHYTDFFQEWSSAHEALQGRSAYPDLPEARWRLLGIDYEPFPEAVLVNAHPPASVILFLPFGCLEYDAALTAFRLLAFGLMVGACWLVMRQIGPAAAPPALVTLILCLTSCPFCSTVYQGQLNAVLLPILVGAWAADRQDREQAAGVLIGLAGALKIMPLLFLGYFLVRGRWRAAAAGAAGFLAANLLAAAILGPGVFREYVDGMSKLSPHRSDRTNAALPGLAAKLFYPTKYRLIEPLYRSATIDKGFAVVAVVLILGLTVTTVCKVRGPQEKDQAWELLFIGYLLVGPLTWPHSLIFLLLPVALTFKRWNRLSAARRVWFVLVAVAIWVSPYALYGDLAGTAANPSTPAKTLGLLAYQTYGLLGFLFLWGRNRAALSRPT
jgi:alpha-1,2-mannosyltransferase